VIRWVLFLALAGALVAYAFWIYLRVDLAVPGAKRLAVVRAATLVVVLTLLFDVRLPAGGEDGVSTRWVLLDASLSMGAVTPGGTSAWASAVARADQLAASGWHVATFGGDPARSSPADPEPTEVATLLGPALERAAESGAREVVVLSDHRYEDAVAVRSALETLPLDVRFEEFGEDVPNAGVTRFDVEDFPQPDDPGAAEIEVHGGVPGEELSVEVYEEERLVATMRTPAPAPGLRARVSVELPPPSGEGRVRYSASVRLDGDAFAEDDAAVDYAAVGRQEGALVVLSLSPDWEPRYLLPVLRDVTGLPTVGYLRAGPDRFVRAGRAVERGRPVDSVAVRRALTDAAVVVFHGLSGTLDAWTEGQVVRPGRKILMVHDVPSASLAGVEVAPPRGGEWYVSDDVPSSPIAGSLAGVSLQGLPPLTDVLVASVAEGSAPLLVQLRGAGEPAPMLHLAERPTGRVAVALATGFWRWAARDVGRDAYRRLWSGVVGWLLADQAVLATEPRPARWVVPRGDPVLWNVPADAAGARLVVQARDSVVADTIFPGTGTVSAGSLPPGAYSYHVEGTGGDTLSTGRFDVASASEEMLPVPAVPPEPSRRAGVGGVDARPGTPLRTLPWPYLLVIALLCGEWIGRRRSGLR
jgi:hypothetical protein